MVALGGGVTSLVVGIALLLLSFGMAGAERHRRGSGVVVPGVVVGSETKRLRHGGSFYEAALVEFRDGTGGVRRFHRGTGTTAKPAEGTRVQVRYDPSRPDVDPTVEEDGVLRIFRVGAAVLGTLATCGGVAVLGPALGLW